MLPFPFAMWSEETVQPHDVPQNVDATTQDHQSILVTWNSVSGSDLYEVRWKRSSDPVWGADDTTASTSMLVDNLVDDIEYEFQVRARRQSDGVWSDWSDSAFATTDVEIPPTVPSNLQVTAQSVSRLVASWDSVSDADLYGVRWRENGTSTWSTDTTSSTSYTIPDLSVDTEYETQVQARRSSDQQWSDWSSSVLEFTQNLNAPSSLDADAQDASTILLTWTKNDNGGDHYHIQRQTSAWEAIETAYNKDATSYTDTDLLPETTYDYRLRVEATTPDGTYTGSFSNIATETTPEAAPTEAPILNVVGAGDGYIRIGWEQVEPFGENFEYEVFRSTTDKASPADPGDFLTTVPHNEGFDDQEYIDNSVSAGTTYYYWVRAVNEFGDGPFSNRVNAAPSGPNDVPQNFSGTALNSSEVELTWDNDGRSEFKVLEYNPEPGTGPWQLIDDSIGTSATSYIHDDVTWFNGDATYRIRFDSESFWAETVVNEP